MKSRWVLGFALVAVTAASAFAHHSLAGIYDTSRQVTMEGTVVQFHFVNPHPFIMLSVEERGRGAREWRLELDNRSELVAIGMTAETLKKGDRIAVSGNPGRDEAASLYVYRLDRPADGLRYEQIGTTPRIRIP